jgi:hypothetical protein
MCLRKLFPNWFKPEDPPVVDPPTKAKRKLLTFGRNLYGGGNDLNGCVNDSNNISKMCLSAYADFVIKKFIDYEVTAIRWLIEVANEIKGLSPGATVFIIADCCFAETNTRFMQGNPHPKKNRFLDPGLPPRRKKRKIFTRGTMRWIAFSGCEDSQTCADAYIKGSYQGAFTYFLIKTFQKGMTYKEWFLAAKKQLKAAGYDQTPVIEGPDYLTNRVVFESETLMIHISSHGSYTYDKNGDEEDGQDEGPYFDRLLVDDEIGVELDKIPL